MIFKSIDPRKPLQPQDMQLLKKIVNKTEASEGGKVCPAGRYWIDGQIVTLETNLLSYQEGQYTRYAAFIDTLNYGTGGNKFYHVAAVFDAQFQSQTLAKDLANPLIIKVADGKSNKQALQESEAAKWALGAKKPITIKPALAEERSYILMNRMPGVPLSQLLERPLSLQQRLDVSKAIIEAMDKQLSHGDRIHNNLATDILIDMGTKPIKANIVGFNSFGQLTAYPNSNRNSLSHMLNRIWGGHWDEMDDQMKVKVRVTLDLIKRSKKCSFLENALNEINSIDLTRNAGKIDYYIQQLERKKRELEARQEEYDVVSTLGIIISELNDVKNAIHQHGINHETTKEALKSCIEEIESKSTQDTINRHRNSRFVIANLLLALMGPLYLLAAAYKQYTTGNFIFFSQTNTAKKVQESRRYLDSFELTEESAIETQENGTVRPAKPDVIEEDGADKEEDVDTALSL